MLKLINMINWAAPIANKREFQDLGALRHPPALPLRSLTGYLMLFDVIGVPTGKQLRTCTSASRPVSDSKVFSISFPYCHGCAISGNHERS